MKIAVMLLLTITLTFAQKSPPPTIGDDVTIAFKNGNSVTGKIVRLEPDSVTLLTKDGGGRFQFDQMTPAEQQRLGYSVEKAKAFEATQRSEVDAAKKQHEAWLHKIALQDAQDAAAKAWAARLKTASDLSGTVIQQLDDGILLWIDFPLIEGVENAPVGAMVHVESLQGPFHVDEKIQIKVIDDGKFTYTTREGLQNTISQYEPVPGAPVFDIVEHVVVPEAAKSHFSMDEAAHPSP